jgi:hypothetical protein
MPFGKLKAGKLQAVGLRRMGAEFSFLCLL